MSLSRQISQMKLCTERNKLENDINFNGIISQYTRVLFLLIDYIILLNLQCLQEIR